MTKIIAKRPARGTEGQREVGGATRQPKAAGPRTRRKATNLTLDPAAVAHAEAYRALHGLGSLSQLVNALLRALPSAEPGSPGPAALAPAVRRLLGVARPRAADGDAATDVADDVADDVVDDVVDDVADDVADDARTAYRAHLVAKYRGPA